MQIANDAHSKWNLPIAIRIAQAMEPLEPMWQEDLTPPQPRGAAAAAGSHAHAGLHLRAAVDALAAAPVHRERLGQDRDAGPHLDRRYLRDAQGGDPGLGAPGAIPPHDATGPVNIFACAQICISSANAMMQEHVPAFFKGWYNDIVDPNLDIRDGYLHAPQNPGVGTRLRAGVRERSDAIVRVSDEPGESAIDAWEETDSNIPRSPRMRAELDRLRSERGPQHG